MTLESAPLLLVEEDELLADITAFRLELLGYSVQCVRTAKDALARLAKDPLPSVVLIDTALPDINGFELINRMNADQRTHHIPIMVLSLDADLNTVQRAHRSGAKEYLVLPYDPAVLEQKVHHLFELAASSAPSANKSEKNPKSDKAAKATAG